MIYNYLNIASSVKQSDPRDFLKAQSLIFICQKYVRKGYMEMEKRIYLGPLKLCLIYILAQKYIVCVQYVISTQYKKNV